MINSKVTGLAADSFGLKSRGQMINITLLWSIIKVNNNYFSFNIFLLGNSWSCKLPIIPELGHHD